MTTPPEDPNASPTSGEPPGWGGATPPPPPPPSEHSASWGSPPPPPPPSGPYGVGGQQPFDIGSAVSFGWERFKSNPGPFVVMVLLMLAASVAINIPFGLASGFDSFDQSAGDAAFMGWGAFNITQSIGQLLSSLVGMVLSAALVKGALDTTKGRQVTIGSMFDGLPWAQVLIAGVIVSVASSIGLLLCILPMFVVLFLTMWVNYFIVGRGEDAITALKSSYRLATSRLGDSLVAWIVTFLVVMLGVCLCCVGLLATIPIGVLALAWSFQVLTGEPVA